MTEFTTTTKDHAKEQIAANLANFSYDPANYAYLAKLNVVDLFLDLTDDENLTLRRYHYYATNLGTIIMQLT